MVDAETSAVVLQLKVERAKLIERWEQSSGLLWREPQPERIYSGMFGLWLIPGQQVYTIPRGNVVEVCAAEGPATHYMLDELSWRRQVVTNAHLLPRSRPRGYVVCEDLRRRLNLSVYPIPDAVYHLRIFYTGW